MRILLCGYHEAGYRALRTLVARRHEVLVATHPTPAELPSVAGLAGGLGIPSIDSSVDEVYEAACGFRPDLILSMYYRFVLPDKILALAGQGAFNFHPSLLPRHRGCFSAPWAIIAGDEETGVTCHRVTNRIDSGDVIDVSRIPIEEHATGMSLYYRLVDSACTLFERVVRRAEHGPMTGQPQQGQGSYHDRSVPFDGMIDMSWSRSAIDRFIRALDFPPHPPALLAINGRNHAIRTLDEYDACLDRFGQPVLSS
ncbi:MAG: methionyl-tRNA formyltransferase [Planctomycetota bacterium]|jgi:methionyl-tRNA formyltransferase